MSARAHVLTLLAAIGLTAPILLIALSTAQPLIMLPEGKDPVNQTGSIHITLADQTPEPESDTPAQPVDEPASRPELKQHPEPSPKKPAPAPDAKPEPEPEPEPESVATAADNASKPVAETSARTDEKAVTSQPEKAAKSAESTKKQLRAGASQKTDNYLSKLVRHLSAYQDYPRRARRLGMQGTPVVMFEFDRAGRLLSYRLLKGSSHRILDDAALNMLKQASPFPPVPDDMTSETFRFQLPVAFQLR